MKTREIIKILKKWSPGGLCRGWILHLFEHEYEDEYVVNTEACAIGCLFLEVLDSDSGKELLETEDVSKEKLIKRLSDGGECNILERKIEQLADKHFGLSQSIRNKIVLFNDHCLEYQEMQSELPKELQRAILKLRHQYEKGKK